MKNRILIICSLIIIGLVIIFVTIDPKENTWSFSLPNKYELKKISDERFILGKKENNEIIIKDKDKNIGIDAYIAEIKYGKRYISAKCAKNENKAVIVYFYIIDTESNDLYGPYLDEETYNKVSEKIIDEKQGNWKETTKKLEK